MVCGAWHVPALTAPLPPASADARRPQGTAEGEGGDDLGAVDARPARVLAGLRRRASPRPGWYHHLFTSADRPIARWLVDVAGRAARGGTAGLQRPRHRGGPAGRDAGRPARTAARRAGRGDRGDPGGALRRRRAAACTWSTGGWSSASGSARCPTDTPAVPLAADVAATQRRLRLTVVRARRRAASSTCASRSTLDRSRLLHRLRLLGVDWGTPADAAARGQGTFWEAWRLRLAARVRGRPGRGQRLRHHRRAGRRPRRSPSGRGRPTTLGRR